MIKTAIFESKPSRNGRFIFSFAVLGRIAAPEKICNYAKKTLDFLKLNKYN